MWKRVFVIEFPLMRDQHKICKIPGKKEVLLFGGYNIHKNLFLNDVWTFNYGKNCKNAYFSFRKSFIPFKRNDGIDRRSLDKTKINSKGDLLIKTHREQFQVEEKDMR